MRRLVRKRSQRPVGCKQLKSFNTRMQNTQYNHTTDQHPVSCGCTHDDASPSTHGGDRGQTKEYIAVIDDSSKFTLNRSDKTQISGITEEGARDPVDGDGGGHSLDEQGWCHECYTSVQIYPVYPPTRAAYCVHHTSVKLFLKTVLLEHCFL